MYKILIVEDDSTINGIIAEHLKKWGHNPFLVEDFEFVIKEYTEIKPHLVLMDINLPFYDGFYWCEKIRNLSSIPIIFISSRYDNVDKIRAISDGADDYIEKPFSMDVLIAKINAMLRRTYDYNDSSFNIVTYENMILDLEKAKLLSGNTEIDLSRNECSILSMLLKSSGKIVSRTKLITAIWTNEKFVDENTLSVNVTRLRKKLKEIDKAEMLETIKGKGYRIK